jgi:hypothetical protein
MVNQVFAEAKGTPMILDPSFVESVCLAFQGLGCVEESIDCLNDALQRGVRVRESTLTPTLQSGKSTGRRTLFLADIAMLAAEVSND